MGHTITPRYERAMAMLTGKLDREERRTSKATSGRLAQGGGVRGRFQEVKRNTAEEAPRAERQQ